ncbi:RNA-binding domain-containing protein [Serendipita vermifera]|nr:RNA-binding domain-containing protein [Serendipita vermifera]
MTAPNNTIYIKNLNDGINKQELRAQLYALFLPYGQVLDVIALKTPKMRGQAFVVFSDLVSATSALRAWDGELFYDKPMRIEFAKTKSWATLKMEDPNFVPGIGTTNLAAPPKGGKRPREADDTDEKASKKEKRTQEPAEEEMEIEDDD